MNKKKLSKLCIDYEASISDALKKINLNHLQFCFLIDSNKKLKGIVTDGDLRRAIIDKLNINSKVKKIISTNFKFLYEDEIFFKNKDIYLDKYNLNHIPIINKKKEIVDYITRIKSTKEYNFTNIYVLILAGGYGKRLLPLTKDIPKPMIKIKKKPILEYLINKLEFYDLKNILISTFYKQNIIKRHFKDGKKYKVNINYTNEKKPLGTAGPLKYLMKKNYDNYLIINSDVFTNLNLNKFIDHHIKNKFDLTIFSILNKTHLNFGVINHKGKKVINIIEKPILKNKILGGMYLLNQKILKLCNKKYMDMDELINIAVKNNFKVSFFLDDEVFWSDLGTVEDLEKVSNLNIDF